MATDDLAQTRLALAALSACIVKTLGEPDPTFPKTFERYLDAAYRIVRERPGENVGAMETLFWTGEFLKQL